MTRRLLPLVLALSVARPAEAQEDAASSTTAPGAEPSDEVRPGAIGRGPGVVAASSTTSAPRTDAGPARGPGPSEVEVIQDDPERVAPLRPPPSASPAASKLEAAKLPPEAVRTENREVPNLDGRPEPPPDAGDVLIWVPRVLLAPVHLVLEWGIRKPLGALLTVAERERWAALLIDFFTFEDRKIGIIPTFFYDFNFRPSIGLYIFWNELFVEPHSIRLVAGWGGQDWYRLSFIDRWALSDRSDLDFAFSFWGRPDYIFSGIGLDADPDNRSRYFLEFWDAGARLLTRPWRRSELRVEAGVRRNRFRDGMPDDDEFALREAVALGLYPTPVGFETGYFASYQQALVRVDTRLPRPAPGSGGLAEAYLRHGWDIERPGERQWLGYGGSLGGYLDLGQYRVLGLFAQVHLVNPIGDREVPFTELFVLGRRPNDLAGFLPGDLTGPSAAVLSLEYTYPIWVFLDGALNFSVGNVFGRNLRGFDVGALRASLGLGVQSARDEENAFTLLLAFGTSEFDEPFAFDSFRFLVGTQTGF